MFGSCRRDFFSKNEPTKPKNFYNTPITEKKNGIYMEARLNDPCGKFKLTNTADDQVDLTPGWL